MKFPQTTQMWYNSFVVWKRIPVILRTVILIPKEVLRIPIKVHFNETKESR